MSRVSLSAKHARTLLRAIDFGDVAANEGGALDALRSALAPRPASSAKRRTAAKRAAKKEETSAIREAVFARAYGLCEFDCGSPATDLHHAFGRVRVKQSERNCLALCRFCHRSLTDNNGGAAQWWEIVAATFDRLGFATEAGEAYRKRDKAAFKRAAVVP